jgi:hypothetical protein
MKRIVVICIALLALVAVANAQVTSEELPRANYAVGVGSTWTNSATHYSEWIDLRDVDSVWVTFEFPDSVDMKVYVGDAPRINGLITYSATVADSVEYSADATGYTYTTRLTGEVKQGHSGAKLKYSFSSSLNDRTQTEKYFVWIKKFRHDNNPAKY